MESKRTSPLEQAPSGHHELRALDLVIGGKPKRERKRGKSAFKRNDVKRAAQAMQKAGVQGRIELPGGITVLVDGDGQREPEPNPWEE